MAGILLVIRILGKPSTNPLATLPFGPAHITTTIQNTRISTDFLVQKLTTTLFLKVCVLVHELTVRQRSSMAFIVHRP